MISSAVIVLECRTATDFKCANNLCLPSSVKCDGYDQCGDGSDEAEQCGAFVALCFYPLLRQEQVYYQTRKLSYRKDDRAMRPIYGALKISRVPQYAHGYFPQNFSWAFVPIDPVNERT